MTSRTLIRLIIGLTIAGSALAALQYPTSSVSPAALPAVSGKTDGGALAFLLLPAQDRFMVNSTGLKTVQAVRRLVP